MTKGEGVRTWQSEWTKPYALEAFQSSVSRSHVEPEAKSWQAWRDALGDHSRKLPTQIGWLLEPIQRIEVALEITRSFIADAGMTIESEAGANGKGRPLSPRGFRVICSHASNTGSITFSITVAPSGTGVVLDVRRGSVRVPAGYEVNRRAVESLVGMVQRQLAIELDRVL